MPATHLDAAIERYPAVGTALAYAQRAHAGQTRSTGDREMPFIEHPVAVAERLARHGYADEVLAAALLHDVIEKSETDREDVEDSFGEAVADLVAALSEDDKIESYGQRKEEHRRRVSRSGPDAQAIFAADKLVNLEALRAAYRVRGEDVDGELKIPLDRKVRTWQLDLAMLTEASPDLPVVAELAEELAGLLAERVPGSRPAV